MMDIDDIKEDVTEIKATVQLILKVLNGNGAEGLCTKVALHQQRMDDMPSPTQLKVYAAAGGGAMMAFALIVAGALKLSGVY